MPWLRDHPGWTPPLEAVDASVTEADAPVTDPDDPSLYPVYTPTMPESDLHCWSVDVLKSNVKEHLAAMDVTAYRMLGNVNLFYAAGRPGRRVAPDAMLWLNPPSHKSGHPYRIWIDGVPDLVVEVLSAETWPNDVGIKKDAYEAMGVKEYWLFDPHELCPSISNFLRGYRLREGIYAALTPMAEQVEGYATQLYFSEVLATSWGVDIQQRLRVYDAAEEAWYPLEGKEAARRKRAEAEAEQARTQAAGAEAEAEQARTQAADAEAEAQRAYARAAEAEAKIARLQRLLQERSESDRK